MTTQNASTQAKPQTVIYTSLVGTLTEAAHIPITATANSALFQIQNLAVKDTTSTDVISWPTTDTDVELVFRVRFTIAAIGAGALNAGVDLTFTDGKALSLTIDPATGVTVTFNAGPLAAIALAPFTSLWVRIRISGANVYVYVSTSSVFKNQPFCAAPVAGPLSTTLAGQSLTGMTLSTTQTGADATATSTATFDNVSVQTL